MPDQPSVVNHDVDCWVVETAIRTRITSTSRPAARARIWKARSPSARCCVSGRADPAGAAGSARVTVFTTGGPPRPRTSRQSCCGRDRKSTRLNSSHPSISYAVFCLKKKKKKKKNRTKKKKKTKQTKKKKKKKTK